MIDAEERAGVLRLPSWIALAAGKPDELERVAVRIAEVERPDAASSRVRERDGLRRGRDGLDSMIAKPPIRGVHVSDHDGHVLESLVVALRALKDRPASLGEFVKLHVLAAQVQARRANSGRRQVFECGQRRSRELAPSLKR